VKALNFIIALAIFLSACGPGNQNKTENEVADKNQTTTDSSASCSPNSGTGNSASEVAGLSDAEAKSMSQNLKVLKPGLPVIGVLMYNAVLTTELTAPLDVFTKHTEDGRQLFNVITIADSYDVVTSEEGLKMFPDYTLDNAPQLDIIIVPSAYDMSAQVKNKRLLEFIKKQDEQTDYTVSNCAGATLIGESGVADGHKIVTWIGGGKDLQKNYPNLKVQDDGKVSFIEDGKFLSSNGNLASYISSLELLEKLTNRKHREFVESYLYLDRLQNWKK
jgi:transcriptional regulator GlxA family with amidase domain